MASSGPASGSYIIIGAGNFGAATALSLKKGKPHARVVLVDSTPYPNRRAASHDINKIVRDDYPDILYMRMMLKAMERWRSDPLYSKYFHQTGYLRADPSNFSEGSLKAYEKLGVKNGAKFLTVTEARKKFPTFATAEFAGLDKVFWHPGAGWADAESALTAVIQAAVESGAEYKQSTVKEILIGAGGKCIGVLLSSGEQVHATTTLMATGAATAVLLAESLPCRPEIQAGNRVMAAGAVSFYASLKGEQYERFLNVPVFKNCLKGTKGEGMSMTPGGIIKFNCDLSFTNIKYHMPTQQQISTPPMDPGQYDWTSGFPQTLIDLCKRTMKGLYGDEAHDVEIQGYRMCWDAETPYHDFLITAHPHIPQLYVATGGSFHGWKFLPVIGDYILQMLDGSLPEEYAERWAWDAKPPRDGQMANPTYRTETDLSQLLDDQPIANGKMNGARSMKAANGTTPQGTIPN